MQTPYLLSSTFGHLADFLPKKDRCLVEEEDELGALDGKL